MHFKLATAKITQSVNFQISLMLTDYKGAKSTNGLNYVMLYNLSE